MPRPGNSVATDLHITFRQPLCRDEIHGHGRQRTVHTATQRRNMALRPRDTPHAKRQHPERVRRQHVGHPLFRHRPRRQRHNVAVVYDERRFQGLLPKIPVQVHLSRHTRTTETRRRRQGYTRRLPSTQRRPVARHARRRALLHGHKDKGRKAQLRRKGHRSSIPHNGRQGRQPVVLHQRLGLGERHARRHGAAGTAAYEIRQPARRP